MSSNFNVTHKGYNTILRYSVNGGTYTARVRVPSASYSYGVVSTESHSRTNRAFYPHRRGLGQFTIQVDCIGYQQHKHFQNWLRNYAEALLTGQMSNRRAATIMEVQMKDRHFHKYGILSTGIDEHDNVGSMVFSPTLTFATLRDFNDPGTSIKSIHSVSQFVAAPGTDSLAFYPVTASSYKDGDSSLYDLPINQPITTLPTTTPTPGSTGPVKYY